MKMTETKTKKGASLEFAQALFQRGTDAFGPKEIKAVTRLDVETLPIHATEEELKRARELNQMLIYRPPQIPMSWIMELTVNKTLDGRPLLYSIDWYAEESFYTSDYMRPGWWLTSREEIPGSRGKNYLEQTSLLCDYITNSVYVGTVTPKSATEAIVEFHSQEQELEKLLSKDWKEAAKRLVGLKVNQLFRESPAEALWSLVLSEGVNHERLLGGCYTWTNKLSSLGAVAGVGSFAVNGVSAWPTPTRGAPSTASAFVSPAV